MRKILSCLAVMLLLTTGNAQIFKSALQSLQFSENLNKVVLDFRNNFYRIQAEALTTEGEKEVYRSSISLPGSVSSVIFRFNSRVDTTASWQATMFEGDTYSDALKAYRNTSRLLNKCRLTLSANNAVGFSGKLNEPSPNLTFASSSFKLNTEDPAYAKFCAEIEMVNTGFDSWEVHLNLHNKKDDSEKY